MSYQPPPPMQQPQGQQQPADPRSAEEQRNDKVLEEILGGKLPGAEYLFAADPEKRQANLVKTTPEQVRDALLRATEVCAQDMLMPYGVVTKSELGKAALAASQAYLLLDPTVDEQGVPVGAQAQAQGASQAQSAEAGAQAQSAGQMAVNEHKAGLDEKGEQLKALLEAHGRAHASGQAWTFPVTETGHALPPRVKPNPAEAAVEAKNKPKTQELKGTRADRPLPKPRVGA